MNGLRVSKLSVSYVYSVGQFGLGRLLELIFSVKIKREDGSSIRGLTLESELNAEGNLAYLSLTKDGKPVPVWIGNVLWDTPLPMAV